MIVWVDLGVQSISHVFLFWVEKFKANKFCSCVLFNRGLFIIDDKGNLRQITVNDLPVGRSVDETLRLVQAFQFTDKHGEGQFLIIISDNSCLKAKVITLSTAFDILKPKILNVFCA